MTQVAIRRGISAFVFMIVAGTIAACGVENPTAPAHGDEPTCYVMGGQVICEN